MEEFVSIYIYLDRFQEPSKQQYIYNLSAILVFAEINLHYQ